MGVSELFPPSFFRALAALGGRVAREGLGHAQRPRPGLGSPGFERRAYSPGDEPRLVDWRASARVGLRLTRLREEERGGELLLLLDRSASLVPGNPRRELDQRRLALALGWRQLQAGGRVRLLTGTRPPFLCTSFDRRGLLRRALEELPAPAGAAPLPAGPPARRRVLLTDPWGPLPTRLPGGTTVVTLVLPEEDRPPAGRLALRAVESGTVLEVDLDPAAHARRWEAHLQGRQRSLVQAGARAPLLRCAGPGAPAEAILGAARETGLV